MKYTVKDVVCDYGVFEGEELRLIVNSRRNAEIIAQILNFDWELPNTATDISREQLTQIYDAQIWKRNMRLLNDGMLGDISSPQTHLKYWQAQAKAHYPCAEENVKYWKDVFEKEKKNERN